MFLYIFGEWSGEKWISEIFSKTSSHFKNIQSFHQNSLFVKKGSKLILEKIWQEYWIANARYNSYNYKKIWEIFFLEQEILKNIWKIFFLNKKIWVIFLLNKEIWEIFFLNKKIWEIFFLNKKIWENYLKFLVFSKI